MKLTVMSETRRDRTPWLLLPCILLALSGVTLLAPHQAAQAAPNAPTAVPKAAPPEIGDDGDGDELLEHWGDPKYAREGRLQMVGMTGGFLVLGVLAYRRRIWRQAPAVTLTLESVAKHRKAA